MHPPLALPSWMDATYWLNLFGPWALWGAVAIVFAECGLLLGFFLPGDSLLFTIGLLISRGDIKQPLWVTCVLLTAAAFTGNVSGYEIGRRSGPAIFRREDSRLFRREYVDKTVEFFDTYGARAIVLARFVPIVRTFITVVAGVGRMDRRSFLLYSGIGGTVWASGVTILGSLLGRFSFIQRNIEAMLLLIVFVSVLPVGVEYLRERRRQRRNAPPAPPPAAAGPVFPPAAAGHVFPPAGAEPVFPPGGPAAAAEPLTPSTLPPPAGRRGGRHASNN